MKRFVFREAKLLALKKQEQTLAELAAAKASKQVKSAGAVVDDAIEAIQSLASQIMKDGSNGLTHLTQTAFGLRARLEQANQALAQKKNELTAALAVLRGIKTNTESLASLHDAKHEEHRQDCQKHAQAEQDYNSTRKWMIEFRDEDH